MAGTLTGKVIALALAFAFALAVLAFALALRFSLCWWYVLGSSGTWAIGFVVSHALAIGTNGSIRALGPLGRRAKSARVSETPAIVTVQWSLHIFSAFSFSPFAKGRKGMVLFAAISNRCPILAP